MTTPKKWHDCEAGIIDQMLSDQEKTQAHITRRRALSALAVGSVGTVGAVFYANSMGDSKPAAAQMACEQVHKHLRAFVDNEIADLYVRGLVSRHLFVCQACQKAYQGMIDGKDFSCDAEQEIA